MNERMNTMLRRAGAAATLLLLAGTAGPTLADSSGASANAQQPTTASGGANTGAEQTRREKRQVRAIMARVKAQLLFLEHRTAEDYADAADASIATLKDLFAAGADDAAIMDALIASLDAFDAVYDAALATAEQVEARAEQRLIARKATDKQVRNLNKMIDRFARNLDEIELGEIERVDAALQDLVSGGEDDPGAPDGSDGDDCPDDPPAPPGSPGDDDGNSGGGPGSGG